MSQVTPLLMPQAGNSMEEGTLLKWHVAEGERVTAGQIICEVETDKATVEVEATATGRLAKIVAREGAVVPVKQAIAYLAESEEDLAAYLRASAGREVAATKVEAPAVHKMAAARGVAQESARLETGRRRASPAARRLARDRGIELMELPVGSGPEGRILSTDIPAAATGRGGNHFYVRCTIDADAFLRHQKSLGREDGADMDGVLEAAVARAAEGLDGVFAVQRIATAGVDEFAASVPAGRHGVVAFAAVREAVMAQHGVMRAGRVMTVTLTADGRLVEPATAAALMGRLRELLESAAALPEAL